MQVAILITLAICVFFLVAVILRTERNNAAKDNDGHEQYVADLKQRNADLERRIIDLDREKDSLDRERAALEAELKVVEQQRVEDCKRLESTSAELKAMNDKTIQLTAQISDLKARIETSEKIREEMEANNELRFKELAANALKENSENFNTNSGNLLNKLIDPLKQRFEDFTKKVDETYSHEQRERLSLEGQIKTLVELNNRISNDARELSQALRGNTRTQGDWGEMILESLLEKSGLQKGMHFDVQVNKNVDGSPLKDENGVQLIPDVVIYYPEGRCIVIDSKVSLTAFVDYANADDPESAKKAAASHVASVKRHVDELEHKKYQDFVGDKQMDFVMMFIPNESAYMAAMQIDVNLWQYAYDKRVLIVSPTHVISILRMLEQLWKQDTMNRNVMKIKESGASLLAKMEGYVSEMETLGNAVKKAGESYSKAFGLLVSGRGSVSSIAEKLVNLGVTSGKSSKSKSKGNIAKYFEDPDADNLSAPAAGVLPDES